MQCPKCSYNRLETDDAPSGMCPRCGLIYAKYVPPTPKPEPLIKPEPVNVLGMPRETNQPAPNGAQSKWETTLEKLKTVPVWAVSLLLGVLLGYFIGREHIKYELRSALEVAADGLRRSFGDTQEKKAQSTSDVPPFALFLLKKEFREANFPKVQAGIIVAVAFDNLTGKDVRAFDGTITFTDLLDNKIMKATFAVNEPVNASNRVNWSGELEYNQFMSNHKALRTADLQNIKLQFAPNKILFSDGTTKQY